MQLFVGFLVTKSLVTTFIKTLRLSLSHTLAFEKKKFFLSTTMPEPSPFSCKQRNLTLRRKIMTGSIFLASLLNSFSFSWILLKDIISIPGRKGNLDAGCQTRKSVFLNCCSLTCPVFVSESPKHSFINDRELSFLFRQINF